MLYLQCQSEKNIIALKPTLIQNLLLEVEDLPVACVPRLTESSSKPNILFLYPCLYCFLSVRLYGFAFFFP